MRRKQHLVVETILLMICWLAWVGIPAYASQHAVVTSPSRVATGEIFIVEVRLAEEHGSARITWLGRTVPVPMRPSPRGAWGYVLLGAGLGHSPGTKWLKVEVEQHGNASAIVREVEVVQAEFAVQRLTLPRKMVHLDEATLERHAMEKKQVADALATVTPRQLWSGSFSQPVQGAVSSTFGLKRILNGEERSPHKGVDFRGAAGTPVGAVNSGRVLLVADHYFAGRSVYVDHGLGVVSMYFHLLRPAVKMGEMLNRGDVVGYIGRSGRATGAHLHLGLSVLGELLDPLPLFKADITEGRLRKGGDEE